METILLLLLLLVTVFLILMMFRRHRTKVSTPPGPTGLLFIGNLHQFHASAPHETLRQLSDKYGPIMSIKLGFKSALVFSSSIMAQEVMQKHDEKFCSRPSLLAFQKLSYNGLDIGFSPYSEYWREMRKITVLHLLSSKRVQSFRPVREDEVYRMMKTISKEASLSKIINLQDLMMSMIASIICRIGFGKRYDEEDEEIRSFFAMNKEVQAVLVNFYFSDYFPIIGWLDKLTGAKTRLENVFEKWDRLFQKLIDNHLDKNRPKSMDGDIIDILLRLREDASRGTDVDHIKAVLMNVVLAGTDTNVATIVWVMTLLIKNPHIMKQVQSEIRNVLGSKNMVDEDDCKNLPYLKAVVKETLRLHLPVPLLLPRETLKKCMINGYEIHPKTLVYVNAWAIARDPQVWEKPDQFMPERFLTSKIDVKGRDFMLIPFGAGRRVCPGISMGLATVELALANMLYLFDWSLPYGVDKDDIDTQVLPGLTIQKKNPLLLMVNKHHG